MLLFSYLKQEHWIIPSFWTFTTWIRSKNWIGTSEMEPIGSTLFLLVFFGVFNLSNPTNSTWKIDSPTLFEQYMDTLFVTDFNIPSANVVTCSDVVESDQFFFLQKFLCYNVFYFSCLKICLWIHFICCSCQVHSRLDWGTMWFCAMICSLPFHWKNKY